MVETVSTGAKKYEKIVKGWFSSNTDIALFCLIAFTIIVRLYYFFVLKDQPIWWDEGDYLAIAKVWALGQEVPEWWSHFTGMRPLLLPLIWAGFFKIGFGELFLRFFTLLLPSIASVFLVYLIGKEMYSRQTGIIAGFMLSVYWVFSFYTFRLLTDIPSVFFGLLCIYFFYNWYYKNGRAMGLYLFVLFGVLGFSTRFPLALIPVTCILFLILTKRFSFLKEKTTWKAVVLGLLFISPYIFYLFSNNFALLRFYFGAQSVHEESITWHMIPFVFQLIESFWAIALVIGLVSLLSFFLYFDLIIKRKSTKFDADLFVFLWIIIQAGFYMVIFKAYTDRWILMMMPALFIVASKGIILVYEFTKKYSKELGLVLLLLLVFGGAYQNFSHSDALIQDKKASYLEIKEAGIWLKENTPVDSKIITASIVQNQYYSERQSYDFFNNASRMPLDCIDKFGATVNNESCQSASEALFEEKREELQPDYFIASAFEPVFTPSWVYSYGQKKNLSVVQAYFDSEERPLLIIYQF